MYFQNTFFEILVNSLVLKSILCTYNNTVTGKKKR